MNTVFSTLLQCLFDGMVTIWMEGSELVIGKLTEGLELGRDVTFLSDMRYLKGGGMQVVSSRARQFQNVSYHINGGQILSDHAGSSCSIQLKMAFLRAWQRVTTSHNCNSFQ